MKEADLFRAYGADPQTPIPQTYRCSTPKCLGQRTLESLFCTDCSNAMLSQLKKKPDG